MLFLFLLTARSPCIVDATIASPRKFKETQPDGTLTPLLRVEGGPKYNFIRDDAGYTIMDDGGEWKYAVVDKNSGKLEPSNAVVGETDPKSLEIPPWAEPAPAAKAQQCGRTLHSLLLLLQRYCEDPSDEDDNSFRLGGLTLHGSGRARRRALRGGNDTYVDHIRERRRLQGLSTGVLRNLCILIRFADHEHRKLPTVQEVDTLLNKIGGDPVLAPSGSVRDLYKTSSYDKLDLVSTVVGWVQLPQNEAYYAGGKSGSSRTFVEALKFSLDQLDSVSSFSFSNFDKDNDGMIDSLMFLHSGYGAEWGATDCMGQRASDRIWSHKFKMDPIWKSVNKQYRAEAYHTGPSLWGSCGDEICRIGTISHEIGHSLGLPDLYLGGSGVGSYGLMGNSWGFDGSQLYPPTMCAWSKIMLGWVNPIEVSQSGKYTLEASYNAPQVLKITEGFPDDEYLLIENRQPIGFDRTIPQGGLLIWHIDDKASFDKNPGYPNQPDWPQNGNHYRVALLQNDGSYDLERGENRGDQRDTWHADSEHGIELGPSDQSGFFGSSFGPFPNTDSYQKKGNVTPTGIRVYDISKSGSAMTFRISLGDGEGENIGMVAKPNGAAPSEAESAATELGTTFKGGYANFGVQFDVVAGPRPVIVTSLHLNTRFEGPGAEVLVYTKPNSHSGFERNPSSWKLFCHSKHVFGKGPFKRSAIPPEDCEPIMIEADKTQGFYVTMMSKDLIYSAGESFLGELAGNSDIKVLEGHGIGGNNFGPAYKPRTFNGFVMYSVERPGISLLNNNPDLGGKVDKIGNELETTFSGKNGSYGSMFNCRAKAGTITVTGMLIHTRAEEGRDIPIEVYTKPGPYQWHEKNPEAWTKICTTNVKSEGRGHRTAIPPSAFDPVVVDSGKMQAFYVTLKSADLRYSNGDFPASDDWIKIEGGAGIGGYPFGFSGVYQPRAANVVLTYAVLSTLRASAVEKPNIKLATTNKGGSGSKGTMFDLKAKNNVVITSLDIYTNVQDSVATVSVYSKQGSHVGHEKKSESWIKVCTTDTMGRGATNPVAVPKDSFTPVEIAAGQIQSFFVVMDEGSILYTNADHQQRGDIHRTDDFLEVMVGTGIAGFPLTATTDSYEPRIFNGAVNYYPLRG